MGAVAIWSCAVEPGAVTQPELGLGISEIVRADVEEVLARVGAHLAGLAGTRVLVAGGGGFLLSLLVDVLLAANDAGAGAPMHVTVVDNLSTGSRARLAHLAGRADVSQVHHDVARPLELDAPSDVIVHGASVASPIVYRRDPVGTIEANVWGTRHLLDHAVRSRARSFVFMSSSEVYGDPEPDAIPTPETYPGRVSSTGPRACYDESKRLGETLTLAVAQEQGLEAHIVRPFNVYGPRLSLDDGRIVPDLLRDALVGGPLHLYSDGRATRSFCYATDQVDGIVRVMTSNGPPAVFNIGNDDECTIRELARTLTDVAGGSLTVEHARHDDADYLTDNPNRRCPDLTRSRTLLGYQSMIDLRTGLGRTLQHYRLAREPVRS
jgi:dTDP-glucose 4,6-dehydratase/UDP-glucuronate decarboxylase